MNYRCLGSTQLRLSEIGLGCASYWGKEIFPESEAMKIVHAAIDEGVTLFDTGHSYSEGNAEKRLGKALRETRKYDMCVSTKAGTRLGKKGRLFKDFSPQWIRESCMESLRNLHLDALPIFQL